MSNDNTMLTTKDFSDIKIYFDFAYKYLYEAVSTFELHQHYKRMNELEVILYEYINKPPNTEESPE